MIAPDSSQRNSCDVCEGSLLASADKTFCGPCNAGFGLTQSKTECVESTPGHFPKTIVSATDETPFALVVIESCPAGSFQDAPRQSSCDLCPSGKHSSESGVTSCIPCPASTFESEGGQVECRGRCSGGKVAGSPGVGASSEDELDCRACLCSIGQTCIAGSEECNTCEAGTYAAAVGATECTQCGNGKWSAAMSPSCEFCDSGYIPNADQTGCEVCPPSTYSIAGDSLCGLCLASEGEVSSIAGSSRCEFCGPGFRADADANSCVACVPSKYR